MNYDRALLNVLVAMVSSHVGAPSWAIYLSVMAAIWYAIRAVIESVAKEVSKGRQETSLGFHTPAVLQDLRVSQTTKKEG